MSDASDRELRARSKLRVNMGVGLRRTAVVLYGVFAMMLLLYSGLVVSDVYACRLDGMPWGWKEGETLMLDREGGLVSMPADTAHLGLALNGWRVGTPSEILEARRRNSAECAQDRTSVWGRVLLYDSIVLAAVALLGFVIVAIVRWVYEGFSTPPPIDRPA